jgi:hypothetical protein
MMTEDLYDVYCIIRHKEFTDVQGDYRDPLMGHPDQRRSDSVSGGREAVIFASANIRIREKQARE